MTSVAVYFFEHFDDDINEDVRSPRMATLEAIARVRGKAIESTKKLVDESELDGNGFYPRKTATSNRG